MRRYLLFCPLVAIVLLAACNGRDQSHTTNDLDTLSADTLVADSFDEDFSTVVVPKAADELFDDFIFNFAGNRKLQRERIVFPLLTEQNGQQTYLSRSQWKMEHFFMRQGYYILLFDSERHMEIVKDTSIIRAVVEKIIFDEGTIQQYVFNRIRGTWMMTSIHKIPLTQSHNATFLAFYHQFACDPDFQANHLEKTVGFEGPDPDDDFSQMEGIITSDTWEAFAPQLPSKSLYNIVYGRPEQEGNQKIYVLRGIANGLELQMTFRRRGDTWRLSKLIT
ncbi:MAG: DUF4348 domain-containing protein [Prevotella sp.]|nr:DUF4348 domain-containing protein [Prevotella sp.]